MSIPILMYHSVSNDNNPMSISVEKFKKQMKLMKLLGYKSINLKDLSNSINHKTFIITFDDGYENVYLNALPIIKELNLCATCFFVSGYVDKYNIWDEKKDKYKKLKLMNEKQILEWSLNGLEIGSHSAEHKNLKEISYSDKIYQISEPKKYFKEKFDIDVQSFSYPYGSFDDESVKIVRENYKYAVTTNRSRYKISKFDHIKLPRVPISNKDNIFKFILKILTIYEDIKY